MDEKIVEVAMSIILNAGDARSEIQAALKKIKEQDFKEAEKAMKKADENLVIAHQAQTEVIQSACGGEEIEYNLLFSHAMDTLMTVQSEYEITRELVSIFEILNERLKNK